jgi:hypothetical protein
MHHLDRSSKEGGVTVQTAILVFGIEGGAGSFE